MTQLKLAALDGEDLSILSAHLQDAVIRVVDMAYLPTEHRFALIANRFDWHKAQKNNGGAPVTSYERRRTALQFARVLGAQVQNISQNNKAAVIELLAIQYEADDPPAGHIVLTFAGGGAVRLHVECIEVEMCDLGPAWQTKNLPEHPVGDDESDSEGEPTGRSTADEG